MVVTAVQPNEAKYEATANFLAAILPVGSHNPINLEQGRGTLINGAIAPTLMWMLGNLRRCGIYRWFKSKPSLRSIINLEFVNVGQVQH